MKSMRLLPFCLILLVATGCQRWLPMKDVPRHSATIPLAHNDTQADRDRTALVSQRADTAQDARVIFIGDSITQQWELGAGVQLWKQNFEPLGALNLGVSGDRTEHVLDRLQKHPIQASSCRVFVVLIGTNNVVQNTAQEIADGVTAVVKRVHMAQPRARVIVMKIFPRSPKPDQHRQKLEEANQIIGKQVHGFKIEFLDINAQLLQPDGTISKEIMPDFLHLSAKGYQIWTDALMPRLQDALR